MHRVSNHRLVHLATPPTCCMTPSSKNSRCYSRGPMRLPALNATTAGAQKASCSGSAPMTSAALQSGLHLASSSTVHSTAPLLSSTHAHLCAARRRDVVCCFRRGEDARDAALHVGEEFLSTWCMGLASGPEHVAFTLDGLVGEGVAWDPDGIITTETSVQGPGALLKLLDEQHMTYTKQEHKILAIAATHPHTLPPHPPPSTASSHPSSPRPRSPSPSSARSPPNPTTQASSGVGTDRHPLPDAVHAHSQLGSKHPHKKWGEVGVYGLVGWRVKDGRGTPNHPATFRVSHGHGVFRLGVSVDGGQGGTDGCTVDSVLYRRQLTHEEVERLVQDPVHVYPAPFPPALLAKPLPAGGTGTLAANPSAREEAMTVAARAWVAAHGSLRLEDLEGVMVQDCMLLDALGIWGKSRPDHGRLLGRDTILSDLKELRARYCVTVHSTEVAICEDYDLAFVSWSADVTNRATGAQFALQELQVLGFRLDTPGTTPSASGSATAAVVSPGTRPPTVAPSRAAARSASLAAKVTGANPLAPAATAGLASSTPAPPLSRGTGLRSPPHSDAATSALVAALAASGVVSLDASPGRAEDNDAPGHGAGMPGSSSTPIFGAGSMLQTGSMMSPTANRDDQLCSSSQTSTGGSNAAAGLPTTGADGTCSSAAIGKAAPSHSTPVPSRAPAADAYAGSTGHEHTSSFGVQDSPGSSSHAGPARAHDDSGDSGSAEQQQQPRPPSPPLPSHPPHHQHATPSAAHRPAARPRISCVWGFRSPLDVEHSLLLPHPRAAATPAVPEGQPHDHPHEHHHHWLSFGDHFSRPTSTTPP